MDNFTINRIRSEWQALGTAPPSRVACDRLAAREPIVARLEVKNLAELVTAASLSSARLPRAEKAAVIAAMLRCVDEDALIPRAIVQALLPGVLLLSRRMDYSRGPWKDLDAFFADAISVLWELTTTWSGTDRPYAAGDLLSAVRTRLRTFLKSERRHRSHFIGSAHELNLLPAPADRTGEELLAEAIADATGSGLQVPDAAALYATRVLGLHVDEVAAITGVSPVHVRRRRRRAIAELVA